MVDTHNDESRARKASRIQSIFARLDPQSIVVDTNRSVVAKKQKLTGEKTAMVYDVTWRETTIEREA